MKKPMKYRILTSAMVWFLAICASGQTATPPSTLEGWAERLQKFGKALPQEQVFVHMDNTCYYLGDTIYYKAYLRRTDTGAPSQISGVLYAELFNQDGYLVERQLLEMKDGQGHGSFCLPDTLYGGFYELRAYTRWQLNWGAYEHAHTKDAERWFFSKQMSKQYYLDYDKLYSRVFPIYDKPLTPGDYTPDMTLRPMSRVFKQQEKGTQATVTFYPEGGHLVAGAANRVAFEANDEEGRHVAGTLTVKDGAGQQVAQAKAERRGRGSVTFTPEAGKKYTATLAWDGGTTTAQLPETENEGCSLTAVPGEGTLQLTLHTAGATQPLPLGVTVMHEGVLSDFQQTEPSATRTVTFDTSKWPTGIAQFTVFDAQGRVYADRMVFVRQPGFKAQNVKIDGVKDDYKPFEHISVSVLGTPGSTVSVAVRDAAHTEALYDNADILSEMLLSSQIKGFVENPRYYFEADDAQRAQDLDLLLMIQGWRRHDWHTMTAPGAFVLTHIPERTPLMKGMVNHYEAESSALQTKEFENAVAQTGNTMTENTHSQNSNNLAPADKPQTNEAADRFYQKESNLKHEVRMHAEFVKPGASENVVGEVDTKNGTFQIESPRFFEQCFFFLGASDTTKWNGGQPPIWVKEAEDGDGAPNYPEFYVKLNPIHPRFVKPYAWYHCNTMGNTEISADGTAVQNPDGTHTLQQINVGTRRSIKRGFTASKPAFVIDAYTAFNEVCDAGFNTGVYTGYAAFAQNLARTYIGDMNMERRYNIVNRFDTRTATYNMSDKERDRYNHLAMLDKVYIYTDYCPRREGDPTYQQSNQPEVTIDLRLLPNEGRRAVYRDRRYILNGFSVCEDFYRPDYSHKPLPETKDYRRTLFWEPNLRLDAQGKAQVECWNNSSTTRVAVSVEGMATDGAPQTGLLLPGSGKKK